MVKPCFLKSDLPWSRWWIDCIITSNQSVFIWRTQCTWSETLNSFRALWRFRRIVKLFNKFLKDFSAIIDSFWLVLKVVVPKEKTLCFQYNHSISRSHGRQALESASQPWSKSSQSYALTYTFYLHVPLRTNTDRAYRMAFPRNPGVSPRRHPFDLKRGMKWLNPFATSAGSSFSDVQLIDLSK